MKLYTIGHSNHSLDKFISLLKEHEIAALVDVRTSPYSQYNPQFNKNSLIWALPRQDILYRFSGKQLGGRPTDPSCYKSRKIPQDGADYLHEVDYRAIMKKKWFIDEIDQLLEYADQQMTVIMCSEEDPAHCHRHHLISQFIFSEFPELAIYHVRGDGIVFNARSIHKSVDEPPSEQLSLFE